MHGASGRGFLRAVYHHPIAGGQPLVDDPQAATPGAGTHVAAGDGIALADDVDELPAQGLLYRPLRNGERAVATEAVEPDADELTGHEEVIRVVERGAEFLRACGRVERRRHEVE